MSHFLMKSGSLTLLSWLLLFPLSAIADQPADSLLAAPYYSADETAAKARASGTIHIVAVMVEFQEDDNRFTTGDGTFDLDFLERHDIVIDPLPHDKGYFEAHLEFARNYFNTVSGGKLDVTWEVLPEIVQLDEPMSAYSPIGETDEENFRLANLARDAWTSVSPATVPDLSGHDPDKTMFIVFHAGSGRNIELMGTTLDKTPQDIPSVYLGPQSFQRLLDEPGFDGFDIGDPDLKVTNTALLPQTQSRTGEDIAGDEYVLELSINGLLVANIGSFLGLPDLFNTDSGASAIGRFGLMDGASIFSYLGLFPPEPSAWEKIHLGWQEPFDITLDTEEPVRLPAVSLREENSIARHAISSDEHFLVENRHRNPSNEALELTIRTPDGNYVTKRVEPDDERFDPFDASDYDEILEPGVIVNVSNFDWSLPGGPDISTDEDTDADTDRILNGGMLIWHIDNAVIRNTLDDNRVNANSDRRGVQVVEADGARDIGRSPGTGQDRFTNGHAFDFWWSGNDFTVITTAGDSIVVYENRFGPDTRPSNESNLGSPSHFEFYDFSDNIPEAYFYARSVAGDLTDPVSPSFPKLPEAAGHPSGSAQFPSALVWLADMIDDGPDELMIPSPSGFYIIAAGDGEGDYRFLEHPFPSSPVIDGNRLISGQMPPEPAESSQDIRSWTLQNGEWISSWVLEDQPFGPGLVSRENDGSYRADLTPLTFDADGVVLTDDGPAVQKSGETDGIYAELEDDRVVISDGSFHYDLRGDKRGSKRKYVGNIRFDGSSGPSFFILTDDRLSLMDMSSGGEWDVETVHESSEISWPSLVDFNGDGSLNLFITDPETNRIYGYYRDGGQLDYFPVRAPGQSRFTGSPLFADITGDGHQELVAAAVDSMTMTIHAYDRWMNRVEGFPLTAGSLSDDNDLEPHPLLITGNRLFSVAPSGEVRVWDLPEAGEIAWGRVYGMQAGNKAGRNMDRERSERDAFGILNEKETYNWPNPADDHTHIRFETSEPASVDITVINQSGSTVYQTQTDSRGRSPEEIRLNTSSWGNGVYFARVRARSGGESETKMIKIVVTH